MGLFGRSKKNDRDAGARAGDESPAGDGDGDAPVGEETQIAQPTIPPSAIKTPPPMPPVARSKEDTRTRVRAAVQSARDESEMPAKPSLDDEVEHLDDLPEAPTETPPLSASDTPPERPREGDIETSVRSRQDATPARPESPKRKKEQGLHTLVDVVNLAAHQLDPAPPGDRAMPTTDATQVSMPEGMFTDDAQEEEELLPLEETSAAAEPLASEDSAPPPAAIDGADADWETAETFTMATAPSASPPIADPPAKSVATADAVPTAPPVEEKPVTDETQPLDPREAERILTNLLNERKAADRGVLPTDETMTMPAVTDDTTDAEHAKPRSPKRPPVPTSVTHPTTAPAPVTPLRRPAQPTEVIPDPDTAELLTNATRAALGSGTPAIVIDSDAAQASPAAETRPMPSAGRPPRMEVVHELTSDDALPRISTDSREALPVPPRESDVDLEVVSQPPAHATPAAPTDQRPATASGRQRAAATSSQAQAAHAAGTAPITSRSDAAAASTRAPAGTPGTPSSRMTTPSGTPPAGDGPAPAPTPSQASARRPRRPTSSQTLPFGEAPAPPPGEAVTPPTIGEPTAIQSPSATVTPTTAPTETTAEAAPEAAAVFEAQAPAAGDASIAQMETTELPVIRLPIETERDEADAVEKYPDGRLVETESGRYLVIENKDQRSGEDTAVLPALPQDAKPVDDAPPDDLADGDIAAASSVAGQDGNLVVDPEGGASFLVRERTTSAEELAQQIAADAIAQEQEQDAQAAAAEASARIGELLEEEGVVTLDEIARGLDRLAMSRSSVGRALLDANPIDRRDLWSALAARYEVPQLKLSGCKIDKQALTAVPKALAVELRVVPILLLDDVLCVAIAEPHDLTTVRRLRRETHLRIKLLQASEVEIAAALQALFGHATNPVDSIAERAQAPATADS